MSFQTYFDQEWASIVDFVEKSLLFLQRQEMLNEMRKFKCTFKLHNIKLYLDTIFDFAPEQYEILEEHYANKRLLLQESCVFQIQLNLIIAEWYQIKSYLLGQKDFILHDTIEELKKNDCIKSKKKKIKC